VTFISKTPHADVVLIGGGIMSATLGAFIKQLEPDWTISMFERLDEPGLESSDPWNNAGTGHAALCELNYSPAAKDGSVTPPRHWSSTSSSSFPASSGPTLWTSP